MRLVLDLARGMLRRRRRQTFVSVAGVALGVAFFIAIAALMRPISVVLPVLTTTPTPRPRATVVLWNAMLCRSPMATRLWPCVCACILHVVRSVSMW